VKHKWSFIADSKQFGCTFTKLFESKWLIATKKEDSTKKVTFNGVLKGLHGRQRPLIKTN
jgi:hypothetical protein